MFYTYHKCQPWHVNFLYMKILFLLTLLWFFIKAKLIVRDANIAAISRDDIGFIFYLTIQNTANCGYDIAVNMVQCSEDIDIADRDCSIMLLLGGDMGHISPRCFKNVTLLYPNMYLHNRKGSCLIKIIFTNKRHELRKRDANISFDTTVSRISKPAVLRGYYSLKEVSTCKSVDLDPLNNCEPVDCHMKYLGTRNYFNRKWKRCQRVPKCVADVQKHLPDVAYSPVTNKCIDMENLISKRDLRYLQSDESGKTETSAISADFIPMSIVNCHHGIFNNNTGFCNCFDGWTSPPVDKDQNEPTLFMFHMCNIEVSNWYDINSGQIKTVALFIGIGAVLIAIFVIFISFIFHGLFVCISRNRLPSMRDQSENNRRSVGGQSEAATASEVVTKASSTGIASSLDESATQTVSQ